MAAELPASTSEVVLKHGGATPETKGPHLAGLWKSFADTQAGKRTQTGSICLVASELSTLFLNGGIGTYFHLIAHLLAAQAWRVHILYAGQVHDEAALARAPRTLAEAGIGFSHLRDFELPKIPRIMSRHQPWYLQTSWKIRYALEELHRVHHFDLIEFADLHAPGFLTVQAKQAGLAFGDVHLAVKLHASSQWLREGAQQWMNPGHDLTLDYCERYAFEHADAQLCPSRYILEYMRGCGWEVRDDACVGQPYPDAELEPPVIADRGTPELVFFGRLETRKGLEIFLDAIQKLDPAIPVTFLGKDHVVRTGPSGIGLIEAQLKGRRNYQILSDYNRQRALAYLAEGNRVAVIPSLSETFGYTVAECAVNGIPFLASTVGGIPEILGDTELCGPLLFKPTAADMLRRLRAYLAAPAERRRAWRDRVRQAADPRAHNLKLTEAYGRFLPDREAARVVAPAEQELPLVSVAVTYYNLGAYLPECLAALAAQTYPNLEVLIIDDGSTCPHSVRVFQEQQQRYPQFRFLSQANAGPGAARNRGLAEAKGEFFLTVDADNVCLPNMVERLAAALVRNPHLAAMTCYYLALRGAMDVDEGQVVFECCPQGGPHIRACYENVYGDTNAIFRTAELRGVHGYNTDAATPWEDWETFVKLVNSGRQVGVVPELLFYYRVREDGRLNQLTNFWGNIFYPNIRLIRECFAPIEKLPLKERTSLWLAFVGYQRRVEGLEKTVAGLHLQLAALQQAHPGQPHGLPPLRYRLVDRVNHLFKKIPIFHKAGKKSIQWSWRACKAVRKLPRRLRNRE